MRLRLFYRLFEKRGPDAATKRRVVDPFGMSHCGRRNAAMTELHTGTVQILPMSYFARISAQPL